MAREALGEAFCEEPPLARARGELFELSLLGSSIERRYRRFRPEVGRLPWGSLAAAKIPANFAMRAAGVWTRMAYFEYRAAVGITMAIDALLAARAPVDLVAVGSRFIQDELSHAELCARVAAELGGAAPMAFPSRMVAIPPQRLRPIMRAADLVTRVFCLGEAFSLPMAHAAAKKKAPPLVAAVLRRIAKDESEHGSFGWIFLDWAADQFSDEDRAYLSGLVKDALGAYRDLIAEQIPSDEGTLGWMTAEEFRHHAEMTLENDLIAPLAARGLYASSQTI